MITLYRINDCWCADVSQAANAGEIAHLFGTTQIPTAFTAEACSDTVRRHIERLNPGEHVRVHPDDLDEVPIAESSVRERLAALTLSIILLAAPAWAAEPDTKLLALFVEERQIVAEMSAMQETFKKKQSELLKVQLEIKKILDAKVKK